MNNPVINHHKRKSIRLKDFDYASPGAYFVTIATHDRLNLFGRLIEGDVSLNEFGQIARDQWFLLPTRFNNIELDAFVVMPDHIHGIIFIFDESTAWSGVNRSQTDKVSLGIGQLHYQEGAGNRQGQPLPKRRTIGEIIGAYKSLVAKECLNIFKARNEVMGKLWQRNYYEHVIRDEEELNQTRLYIEGNPMMKY